VTLRRLSTIWVALLASAGIVSGQQRPIFRAGTDAVLVDVFVSDQGRAVTGLGADAFELRDNNVRQTLSSISYERAPLDVTLLIETGADTALLVRLDAALAQLVKALQPDDRCALIAFGRRVHQVTGALTGPVILRRPADAGPQPDDSVALFDALATALSAPVAAGRRSVIVVFTRGLDTASFLNAAAVQELGWRTGAIVDSIVASRAPAGIAGTGRSGGRGTGVMVSGVGLLDTLALSTGGSSRTVGAAGRAIGDAFVRVLDDARTSYVLSYTPLNVNRGGWHDVVIRVKKGSYQVRARQGYFGG